MLYYFVVFSSLFKVKGRSFSVISTLVLPYFSHAGWEKYGRNMGEMGVNERTCY